MSGELKLGEVRENNFTEAAGVGQWGGLRGHPLWEQLPPLVQATGRSRVTMSSGGNEAKWKQFLLDRASRMRDR